MQFNFWRKKEQKIMPRRVVRSNDTTPETLEREKQRNQLAQKRLQEIRKQQRDERFTRFIAKYGRTVMIGSITVAVVLIISILVWIMHSQQVYIIKDITFSGNERITDDQLRTILADYQGKSMLLVSNREIENKLKSQFSYLRSVFVRKIIPSKIEVLVDERKPAMTLINLAGVYLLDSDGIVVGIIHELQSEGLTFEQAQIVSGYGDVNAPTIKEFYLSKIQKPEDKAKVDWDKVPISDKEATLNEIRVLLATRLAQQLREGEVYAEQSDFKELNRLYSYKNDAYTQGAQANVDYLNYGLGIRDYFSTQKNLKITQILWESDYSIRVTTEQGKIFIFSSTDDLNYQTQKLAAVIKNGLLNSGNQVDLRGKKIVVR